MAEDINAQKIIVFTKDRTVDVYDEDLDLLGDSPGGVTTVGALRESIQSLMPALGVIVTDVKAAAAAAGLNEVTVALGVNAKGKVGFLGTGSELGGTASLTLKFKIG